MEEPGRCNKIQICGTVSDILHPIYQDGIKYYNYMISIERESGTTDLVHVRSVLLLNKMDRVFVDGRIDYRIAGRDGNRGELYVVADTISNAAEQDKNNAVLKGVITKVKEPKTVSNGKRIRRFVQIDCGAKNSIPCILWGDKSKKVMKGDGIFVKGRIQTRISTNRPVYINGVETWNPVSEISASEFNT